MTWHTNKLAYSSKAGWLAALLCAVLVTTVALGSVTSVPPATAGADASASGLTDTGSQLWHQGSPGIIGVPEGGDFFGNGLASGDFDGDGFDDFAVGAADEDIDGAENAGAVNVIYGSNGGLTADGNQLWRQGSNGVNGLVETDDLFGLALGSGDFDNDGFDDLAIGVPNESIGDVTIAGAVNVLYGSVDGLTSVGDQLWSQDSDGIEGVAETGDRFGFALTTGDFNDDGFDDLAVGVYLENIGDTLDAGAVNIIYGSADGLTSAGDQLWHQDSDGIEGVAEAGDEFGEALASGDFDDDGFDDLAIGVPGETVAGAADAGVVNIIYGSGDGLTSTNNEFWRQGTNGIEGAAEPGDRFGWALTSGDFDGSGEADLAVGVPGEAIGEIAGAGAVNIIYGSGGGLTGSGDQLWRQGGNGTSGVAETEDEFGDALASGDFDNDGFDDLAVGVRLEDIGSTENAGAVHVLYGSDGGLTASGDQLWSQDSSRIFDDAGSSDFFGLALTSGDFDGDGEADLAVGVPGESIDDLGRVGAVNILYASALVPTATATNTATPTNTSVATATLTPTPLDAATATPTPPGAATATPTDTPLQDKEVGDVNSDGQVNAIDAALILQFSAGLIDSVPNPSSADVNSDGEINAIDAALILQFSAGLIGSLPP